MAEAETEAEKEYLPSLETISKLFGSNECEASGSETGNLELWRRVTIPSKVIETYYYEGNYYHDANTIKELASLAQTTPKCVRDTLSRLRKKDEKAGRLVPPKPPQQFAFADEQKDVLLKFFEYCDVIDADGARELARITHLAPRQITSWFCNQRRKVAGKCAERDRLRRARIKKEKLEQGLLRTSPFTAEVIELLEEEYQKMTNHSNPEDQSYKVQYDVLVEKTGTERKKIRDWFSKRKLRGKPYAATKDNGDKKDTKSQSWHIPGVSASLKEG